MSSPHDVVISGIGLVSSLGEGSDAHWQKLAQPGLEPVLEAARFAPYTIHPLPEIDWNLQIAKRGEPALVPPHSGACYRPCNCRTQQRDRYKPDRLNARRRLGRTRSLDRIITAP